MLPLRSVEEAINHQPGIAATSRCCLSGHAGGIRSSPSCAMTRGIGAQKIPGLSTTTPGTIGAITGKHDTAVLTVASGTAGLIPESASPRTTAIAAYRHLRRRKIPRTTPIRGEKGCSVIGYEARSPTLTSAAAWADRDRKRRIFGGIDRIDTPAIATGPATAA